MPLGEADANQNKTHRREMFVNIAQGGGSRTEQGEPSDP